jgi:hypothetical protein
MARRKRYANLSERIHALPTQGTVTPEQLQRLFLQQLLDADSVVPTKPEALYTAKTQALIALANLTLKQQATADQSELDAVLDEE